MNCDEFLHLPEGDVAGLVRTSGPRVVVFPINGTRRWFVLEHSAGSSTDIEQAYLQTTAKSHRRLYRMFFDHGIQTLLTPVFGPDLLGRGDEYVAIAVEGLKMLATDPQFLDFYDRHQIRVGFYGDYEQFFSESGYAFLNGLFRAVAEQTRSHTKSRLFFGVCAQDPTESIAKLAVEYYRLHRRIPEKSILVEMYYGQEVESVDLFIGFDKLSAFDMPLISDGSEDLYFTVCPSLYLTESQLREILYDHLFARRGGETSYSDLTEQDWARMRSFYQVNRGRTIGVGFQANSSGVWYPRPQVDWPDGFA